MSLEKCAIKSIVKLSLQHVTALFQIPDFIRFFPRAYFVLVYLFACVVGEPDLHKNSEDLVNTEEKRADAHS